MGTVETSDWIDIMRGMVVRETSVKKEWFNWSSKNSQVDECIGLW